jgi:hypothetical protein
MFIGMPDGADQAFFAKFPLEPGRKTGADMNIDAGFKQIP